MERDTYLIGQALIQPTHQGTTTCQVNTVTNNIGIQFGGSLFQCTQDSRFHLGNRFFQTVGNFLVRNRYLHRKGRHLIRTMHHIVRRRILQRSKRRTHIYLNHFGRTFAHLHIVLSAHVLHDVGRKVVSGNTDRLVGNNTAQRNNRNFGSTPTYIHNHVTLGRFHIDTDTDCRSHRFVNHVYIATSGMLGRVAYSTQFHFGTARRNTNHHPQRRRKPTAFGVYHLNHAANHLLGRIEVGNHPVAKRTDGPDVLVGLTMHLTCLFPYSQHLVGTAVQGNHRRFVHHNLTIADNNRVGRSKVHCYLLCERK